MRVAFRPVFSFTLLLTALALALHGAAAAAQRPAQDHPGQYSPIDIETGSRLYAGQCALCHGAAGDAVAGADLRRGVFRRSVSDEDLAKVITMGLPDAGMPGFKLQPSEIDGLIAFIRAGFVPADALRVAGLPPMAHTGLTPVTVSGVNAPTSAAVRTVMGRLSRPASLADIDAKTLTAGVDPGPFLDCLTAALAGGETVAQLRDRVRQLEVAP